MEQTIQFLGAAQSVTGSKYLLTHNQHRILVDCGLFQERHMREHNWDPEPKNPSTVEYIILTHAHLDHCGLIPKLVQEGFHGQIIATEATASIAEIVMLDAGKIQEEDAAYKKKRHEREGRTGPHPEVPLYTKEDAKKACELIRAVPFYEPVALEDWLTVEFVQAGHILGASSVRVTLTEGAEKKQVLFSGDVGRWDAPILNDPDNVDGADVVVMESTYGDRKHESKQDIPGALTDVIQEALRRRGNVVIPSFSVERSQDLLYYLGGLMAEKAIPPLMVFLDSPMAVRVTEVFRKHADLFDEDARQLLEEGRHPCDFPSLSLCRSVAESKAINNIKGTCIIIAGSGMCTGGRIKHHLLNNIQQPDNTVLFVGYQAVGTLGREIVEGTTPVRILGQECHVRARIERIEGFSGHADADELLRWFGILKRKPEQVFITHGEPASSTAFAARLAEERGIQAVLPEIMGTYDL